MGYSGFGVDESAMEILILYNEFLALLNITAFEEIFELHLQFLEYSFEPHLQLLGLRSIGFLDTLVDLEYIDHKLWVELSGVLLNTHPLKLHEIDGALEVIEQGCLCLIDVGRVKGHLFLEGAAPRLVELIWVELFLEITSHFSHRLLVNRIALWSQLRTLYILNIRK